MLLTHSACGRSAARAACPAAAGARGTDSGGARCPGHAAAHGAGAGLGRRAAAAGLLRPVQRQGAARQPRRRLPSAPGTWHLAGAEPVLSVLAFLVLDGGSKTDQQALMSGLGRYCGAPRPGMPGSRAAPGRGPWRWRSGRMVGAGARRAGRWRHGESRARWRRGWRRRWRARRWRWCWAARGGG